MVTVAALDIEVTAAAAAAALTEVRYLAVRYLAVRFLLMLDEDDFADLEDDEDLDRPALATPSDGVSLLPLMQRPLSWPPSCGPSFSAGEVWTSGALFIVTNRVSEDRSSEK